MARHTSHQAPRDRRAIAAHGVTESQSIAHSPEAGTRLVSDAVGGDAPGRTRWGNRGGSHGDHARRAGRADADAAGLAASWSPASTMPVRAHMSPRSIGLL